MLVAACSVVALLASAGTPSASVQREVGATPTTVEVAPAQDDPEPASEPTAPVGDPAPETSPPGDEAPPAGDEAPPPGEETPPPDDDAEVEEEGGSGQTTVRVQPTVRANDIAPASIVLAVTVLAGVVLAWWWALRRRSRAPGGPGPAAAETPAAVPGRTEVDDGTTLKFLLELGEALVDAGDAVHNVTGTLESVARVNGKDGLGAVVLPTALILSVPEAGSETTDVAIAGRSRLRLDQIEALLGVVDRAERGELAPGEGRRALRAIRARPHPYPPSIQLAGAAVAAAGLALVLRGGVAEVLLAAVLGVVVGMLNLATASTRYLYRPFWPLLASFVVAVVTFTALRLTDIIAFPALVAPLITFLPGALLTIAVWELATGQILAGSSRLASGGFQLVLLGLGIVAGAQAVGVPASAVGSAPEGPVAVAGPWLGVAVFGLGLVWSQGLRQASIPWILVVLYVAYAGQVIGGVFVGSALSSFFGAVAMTPVAVLLARWQLGPPTLVTFFPGFWILVPGALGLEGVTRVLGDDNFVATGALTTTLTSMVGIALGVVLGLALSAPDPERPWANGTRLRLGR